MTQEKTLALQPDDLSLIVRKEYPSKVRDCWVNSKQMLKLINYLIKKRKTKYSLDLISDICFDRVIAMILNSLEARVAWEAKLRSSHYWKEKHTRGGKSAI